jgi:hypothetical protein
MTKEVKETSEVPSSKTWYAGFERVELRLSTGKKAAACHDMSENKES